MPAPHKSHRFQEERRRMVSDQITSRGIRDERVLNAMATIPREAFVPFEFRGMAYRDAPLPIGFGQTISQPFTVAFLVEAMQLEGSEKVLEIGAGSGYQAAVLGQLAEEVHTVERIPQLHATAEATLRRLGYDNIHVHLGDGTLGLPAEAPFDAIVVTAGAYQLPASLQEQLSDNGRIVIPVGPNRRAQRLHRYTLNDGELDMEYLGRFAFVPLIGELGWSEED